MSPVFTLLVSRRLRAWLVVFLAVSMALVPSGRARGQDQSADNEAVLLAEPGMVFVDTTTRVCVRLKRVFSGTQSYGRCDTWRSSGSGIFVDGSGTLVTASHVVTVEGSERQRLKNTLVNEMFIQVGFLVPNPDLGLGGRHAIADPELNNLLQSCYTGDECQFNIRSVVDVYPAVMIAGVSTPKPLRADVLNPGSFTKSDIAVMKVESSNTPTVPLAASIADVESGQPVTVLGYPGNHRDLPTGMTQPTRKYGFVSAVRTGLVGTGKQIQLDIDLLAGMSGGPALNADGKAIGLVSYSILDEGTPKDGFTRTVDDIRAALKAAGVEAARGEVDSTFEQAMRYYWDHHYSAALPLFQKVLNLYDGHPLAKTYQSKAQAGAGGPEDVPLAPSNSVTQGLEQYRTWLPLVIALLVLVILAAVVLRGRRRGAGGRPRPRPPASSPPKPYAGTTPEWGVPNGSPPAAQGGAGPDQAAGTQTRPIAGAVRTAVDDWEHGPDDDGSGADGPRYCTGCGTEAPTGASFCGRCGRPL